MNTISQSGTKPDWEHGIFGLTLSVPCHIPTQNISAAILLWKCYSQSGPFWAPSILWGSGPMSVKRRAKHNTAPVASSFSSSSCRRGEGWSKQLLAGGSARRRQRRSCWPLKLHGRHIWLHPRLLVTSQHWPPNCPRVLAPLLLVKSILWGNFKAWSHSYVMCKIGSK